MKKTILIFTSLCTLFLSGCYSYRDMNRVHFSTMEMFDVDQADEIVIYSELFTAERGGVQSRSEEKKIVLQGKGETILDAFSDLQTSATFPIAYDVSKALVYTKRAAKKGLEYFIDDPVRDQKNTIKEYIFICEGDPEEIITTELVEEKYIGLYLEEAMIFQESQARILPVRLTDFLNKWHVGSKVSLIPLIGKSSKTTQDRIDIKGAAIMVDDKMVDKISPEEVRTYIGLIENLSAGSIVAKNPEDEGKLLSLMVLKGKVNIDVEYDGKEAIVTIKRHFITSLEEVQGKIHILKKDIRKEVTEDAQKRVKGRIKELLEQFQEKGIDIINVEERLLKKYPNADLKDIIENTTFNVEVTVEIEGSQNKTDNY